jgi:hypothetical protein
MVMTTVKATDPNIALQAEEVAIHLPGAYVDGETLYLPEAAARYVIAELLKHLEPHPNETDGPTHLAHSEALGLVPCQIVACNRSACLVRGQMYGEWTDPVRVSKADLFPYLPDLLEQ